MYELWHRFFQPKKNDIDSYLILWIVAALHTNFGSHTDPSTLKAREEEEKWCSSMGEQSSQNTDKIFGEKKKKKREWIKGAIIIMVFFFFGVF